MFNFIISSIGEAFISLITCVIVLVAVGVWFNPLFILGKHTKIDQLKKGRKLLLWAATAFLCIACSTLTIYVLDCWSCGVSYEPTPFLRHVAVPVSVVAIVIVLYISVEQLVAEIKKKKEEKRTLQSPL